MDFSLLQNALKGLCPKCNEGKIFKSTASLELKKQCPHCGLDLDKNDSADGPAVFIIFILGFLIVPLALWVDAVFEPSMTFHVIVWSIVTLGLTLGMLKPIKSYVIALQYKHIPNDWK